MIKRTEERGWRIAMVRFGLLFVVNFLSLGITIALLPGLSIEGVGWLERAGALVVGTLIIGGINLALLPLLRVLSIPLGRLIIFGSSFFITAALLLATAALLPGLKVDGWVSAFLGSVIMAVANVTLVSLASDERLRPLISHRDIPPPELAASPAGPIREEAGSFAPRTLWQGLKQVDAWPRLALQAFLLNRQAYSVIAEELQMTGPAILLTAIAAIIGALAQARGSAGLFILRWFFIWFSSIGFFYAALRVLRSKATIASLVRVLGFSQTAYTLEALAIVPGFGPAAIAAATLLNFLAAVIGTAAASRLNGRRAWIIPGIALAFVLMRVYFLQRLLDGLGVTLLGLLARLGIIPLN